MIDVIGYQPFQAANPVKTIFLRIVLVLNVQLQMLTILRALAEVAGMFLLAQGALFLPPRR